MYYSNNLGGGGYVPPQTFKSSAVGSDIYGGDVSPNTLLIIRSYITNFIVLLQTALDSACRVLFVQWLFSFE